MAKLIAPYCIGTGNDFSEVVLFVDDSYPIFNGDILVLQPMNKEFYVHSVYGSDDFFESFQVITGKIMTMMNEPLRERPIDVFRIASTRNGGQIHVKNPAQMLQMQMRFQYPQNTSTCFQPISKEPLSSSPTLTKISNGHWSLKTLLTRIRDSKWTPKIFKK